MLFWTLSEDNHYCSSQDIGLVLVLYHAEFLRQDDQQECTWSYSKGFEDMATASSCHEGTVIPFSGAGDSAKSPGSDTGDLKD